MNENNEKKERNRDSTRRLTLTALFSALVVVLTVIPYTGYINYGLIEITTLHIVVIICAVSTDWKCGAIVGGVWGASCMIRALTNPLWAPFINPFVSLLPRIAVGLIAGLLFHALSKTKLNRHISAAITAIAATLVNTVLVLSMYYVFQGLIKDPSGIAELFKTIITTVIAVNGTIELVAAAIIVPLVCGAISRMQKKN